MRQRKEAATILMWQIYHPQLIFLRIFRGNEAETIDKIWSYATINGNVAFYTVTLQN